MQARSYKASSSVKQILMFLLWTFGITWSAWILSAVLKERVPLLYPLLMIVGTFGPAISAKLVLGKSLKEMLAFIKFTRKRSWPYLLIFVGLYTISIAFVTRPLPGLNLLNVLVLALVTTLLTGGNEEIGWQLFTRSVSLSSIVSSFMGSLILLAKPSL